MALHGFPNFVYLFFKPSWIHIIWSDTLIYLFIDSFVIVPYFLQSARIKSNSLFARTNCSLILFSDIISYRRNNSAAICFPFHLPILWICHTLFHIHELVGLLHLFSILRTIIMSPFFTLDSGYSKFIHNFNKEYLNFYAGFSKILTELNLSI